MDEQTSAFLLQLSRQLEIVIAACEQNGSARIMLGSNRRSDSVIQVHLVANRLPTTTSTTNDSPSAKVL